MLQTKTKVLTLQNLLHYNLVLLSDFYTFINLQPGLNPVLRINLNQNQIKKPNEEFEISLMDCIRLCPNKTIAQLITKFLHNQKNILGGQGLVANTANLMTISYSAALALSLLQVKQQKLEIAKFSLKGLSWLDLGCGFTTSNFSDLSVQGQISIPTAAEFWQYLGAQVTGVDLRNNLASTRIKYTHKAADLSQEWSKDFLKKPRDMISAFRLFNNPAFLFNMQEQFSFQRESQSDLSTFIYQSILRKVSRILKFGGYFVFAGGNFYNSIQVGVLVHEYGLKMSFAGNSNLGLFVVEKIKN